MIRTRIVASVLLVWLLMVLTASGQRDTRPPTNLVIEVYYYPGLPPAYMVVSPASSPGDSWFGHFQKVPGWRAPAGSLPVSAVNVRTLLNGGDVVQVSISVFLGRPNEQEEQVARYSLREGERISVRELTQFGVEPFEFKLVRVAVGATSPPSFTSKAKSIELVSMQPVLSTLPSYRLAVRNLSNRNVRALSVLIRQGVRRQLSSMPRGEDGRPLILAGEIAELHQRITTRAVSTPGGYQPVPLADQTIEISTAIFDDGSFEGDIEPAVGFTGFLRGEKIQVASIVRLLQTKVPNDANPTAALEQLAKQASELGTEVDPVELQEAISEFRGLSEELKRALKNAIEISMRHLKAALVSKIQNLQREGLRMDANSLNAWLSKSRERYEVWLSRL